MVKKSETLTEFSSQWDSLEKGLGTGNVFYLREDKEQLKFIVRGVPILEKVTFRKTTRKIGIIPVITETGAGCVTMGAKQFRAFIPVIKKHPNSAIVMTRHGVRDDINTTYSFDFTPVNDELKAMSENYTDKEVMDAAKSAHDQMLENALGN